jgi:hypothetical protein
MVLSAARPLDRRLHHLQAVRPSPSSYIIDSINLPDSSTYQIAYILISSDPIHTHTTPLVSSFVLLSHKNSTLFFTYHSPPFSILFMMMPAMYAMICIDCIGIGLHFRGFA